MWSIARHLIQWPPHSWPHHVIFIVLVNKCAFLRENWAFHWIEHGIFWHVQFNETRRSKISNSVKQKCVKMSGFKHFSKTSNILFFASRQWIRYGVVWQWDTCLHFFPTILIKSVFFKTTCSPRVPPNDLQNVKNSPGPARHWYGPKMGSKPTNLIRDENIQSTATPCSFFFPSFPYEVEPISVSDTASPIFLESDDELWRHELPMTCTICLSFSRISYQFTDIFQDLGFPAVSATVLIGKQVLPTSWMKRNPRNAPCLDLAHLL